MPKLVVLSDRMKDRSFELTQDKVTIGRLPENLICLEDGTISGHHAELIRDGDDYFLRDLNATNGTTVNGRRITETRLCHGDIIFFGNLKAEFLASAAGANRPVTPALGKLVNLSDTSPSAMAAPPSPLRSSGVTAPKRGKARRRLQIALVVVGVAAIALLIVLIIKIAGNTQ